MEDFYDDFSDDFGDDFNGMDDDSMEDNFDEDLGPEDSLDDDSGIEKETTGDEHDDEFTLKDGVILGSAMGWAYEDGLEEAKRRKLEKEMDSDQEQRNNHS